MGSRGRLCGLGPEDADLQSALDEEELCMQQRGTGHSKAAVLLLACSPRPSEAGLPPGCARHSDSLPALLPDLEHERPSLPMPACSPHATAGDARSPHAPAVTGGIGEGGTLRTSAVGRLLDQMVIPSAEEAAARAICDRLVEFVSYQHALSLPGMEGAVERLESYQAQVFRAAYESASGGKRAAKAASAWLTGPPASIHNLLPPLSSPTKAPTSIARTRSLSGPPSPASPGTEARASASTSGPSSPALGLPSLTAGLGQRRASDSSSPTHHPGSRPARVGSCRPPLPAYIPSLAKQISCPAQIPGSSPNAKLGALAVPGHDPFGAAETTLPALQHRSSSELQPRQPRPSASSCLSSPSGLPPQSPQSARSAAGSGAFRPTSVDRHPAPASPGQQQQQQQQRLRRASSGSGSPGPPLKGRANPFMSLTAYMLQYLGGSKQQPLDGPPAGLPRLCSLEEWGGGARVAGKRMSAGFSPALQEKMAVLARQQMDTVRAESRSQLKKPPEEE